MFGVFPEGTHRKELAPYNTQLPAQQRVQKRVGVGEAVGTPNKVTITEKSLSEDRMPLGPVLMLNTPGPEEQKL